MINPSALASKLPPRPLRPDEAGDIADRLGASIQTVVHKTTEGTAFVPIFYLFIPQDDGEDDPVGRELEVYMDDDLTEWGAAIIASDVRQSQWIRITELYASEANYEMEATLVIESDESESQRELS